MTKKEAKGAGMNIGKVGVIYPVLTHCPATRKKAEVLEDIKKLKPKT